MIQIRIAFVLRLVDDFTGACIKRKSFRFWTDEKILHPVQKEEGLYVFLEPLEHPARITIEGTDYYPCTVEVDKHILDPEEPIADIRLYLHQKIICTGTSVNIECTQRNSRICLHCMHNVIYLIRNRL